MKTQLGKERNYSLFKQPPMSDIKYNLKSLMSMVSLHFSHYISVIFDRLCCDKISLTFTGCSILD